MYYGGYIISQTLYNTCQFIHLLPFIKLDLPFHSFTPCPGPIISLPNCPSLAFSFFPNSRPMDDLMPFFLGCLWSESWLLATLLRALASVSNAAVSLQTDAKTHLRSAYVCAHNMRPLAFLFSPSIIVWRSGQRVGHADLARCGRWRGLAFDGGLVLTAVLVHCCDLTGREESLKERHSQSYFQGCYIFVKSFQWWYINWPM